MRNSLSIKRGSLIVLEGLDSSGKSTQIEHLRALPWIGSPPLFMHMPSGTSVLSAEVYRLLETENPRSPLARQLLHLACHAENVPAIRQQRQETAVVLDRFWWSTVAYGWHGSRIGDLGWEWKAFRNLVDTIWAGLVPDVVFLFIDAHEEDPSNSDAVAFGYHKLAEGSAASTVVVPLMPEGATTDLLISELVSRGLAG